MWTLGLVYIRRWYSCTEITYVYNMNVYALLQIHYESGIFMDIMMEYTISNCWPTQHTYRMGVQTILLYSNDLRHHCSRLSELEIRPQSETVWCCADLSPKLPVDQLVTQPIRPSLLTPLSPVAGGAGALWQLMGGADQKRCVHWLVRVDIMMIKIMVNLRWFAWFNT